MTIDPDPYPTGCRPPGFGSLLGTRYNPTKFGSRLADRFDQIEQPNVNLPGAVGQLNMASQAASCPCKMPFQAADPIFSVTKEKIK